MLNHEKFEEFFKTKYPSVYLDVVTYDSKKDCYVLKNESDNEDRGINYWVCVGINSSWLIWRELQAKITELEGQLQKQAKLSLAAIDNAQSASRTELAIAERLKAESSPEMLESEREMNAQLTAENMHLDKSLMAYKHFCLNIGKEINNERQRIFQDPSKLKAKAAEVNLIIRLESVFNAEAEKALAVEGCPLRLKKSLING